MYGAVNKRDLSTGETGELVCGNVGFGLNPGVELALPRRLLSNWRDRAARKNLPNVADTGEAETGVAVKKTAGWSWGGNSLAPREYHFQPVSPSATGPNRR